MNIQMAYNKVGTKVKPVHLEAWCTVAQVWNFRVKFIQQQLTDPIPGRNSASHQYQGPPADIQNQSMQD